MMSAAASASAGSTSDTTKRQEMGDCDKGQTVGCHDGGVSKREIKRRLE